MIPRFALIALSALVCLLAGCVAPGERLVAIATATPPTSAPTAAPTHAPTVAPTTAPTAIPPTAIPPTPTSAPTATISPTTVPAATSTTTPTAIPPRPTHSAPTRTPLPRPAPPAASAHRYVFPVRSEGKISYGKFHHDYPATDIFCPVGSAFVAVIGGVVDYVSYVDSWDPAVNEGATRGGLSVAIIGDDGVRYYGSHLSQIADGIAPGVRVAAGQLLGLTGKTGDARITDAHLHFGISHPTTPDDWAVRRGEIAPYPYLRAWQRGQDLAPVLKR